jgi:hypothetical protein
MSGERWSGFKSSAGYEIRPVAGIIADLVSAFEYATKRLDGVRES